MSKLYRLRIQSTVHLTLCSALLGAAFAGCAEVPEDADFALAEGEDEELAVQAAALQSGQLRDPAGSYIASVKANGTGCPPGSWETTISPDGKTFTTTFNKYIAEVGPSAKVSIKDCQIAVKLHSPQGLSFAVQEFYYSGYAYLDKGVSARQIASYYFQGNQARASEARTELTGPRDDVFKTSDELTNANVVWSPCGTERDLNISTTLRVLNGDPPATGYVNLAALDGNTKLVFKLAWRKCTPTGGSSASKSTPASSAADGKSESSSGSSGKSASASKKETSESKAESSEGASSTKKETASSGGSSRSRTSGGGSIFDLFGSGGGPTVISVTRR